MASSEYESFMFKFKNLHYSEYKASLISEAENGESFVTERARSMHGACTVHIGCKDPQLYTFSESAQQMQSFGSVSKMI